MQQPAAPGKPALPNRQQKRHVRSIKLLISFFTLLLCGAAEAQETEVRFRLQNSRKEAVPFATFQVMSREDSSLQLRKVSDSTGTVTFTLLQNGQYRVLATAVSYAPSGRNIRVTGNQPLILLTAEEAAGTLNNVVVTSTRPAMRQVDDKTIVDPENLAASSTNAYEILEKTPGLFVDQDGNIYLNSTTPATIYINGREQKMSTADIATMLKSLPPGSISSIEILRTPSARYDASGSGGIVNVVLKKGVRIGLTGSVNVGGNRGRYGNSFAGFNINNNNGTTTTYLNVNYSRRNSYEQIRTDRVFAPDSLLSQDAFTRYPAQTVFLGFGLSRPAGKRWELSYDGRLSLNTSRNNSTNESVIRKISSGSVLSRNTSDVTNTATNFSSNQSLSARYKIDSAGSEWTTDLSWSYAPYENEQGLHSVFYQTVNFAQNVEGRITNGLHFYSIQSNLVKKLPFGITGETGLKTTGVSFRNETDYFRVNGSIRNPDRNRSGAYRYTENIHAAYLQGSRTFSGFTLKMGTRVENTGMNGNQLRPSDTAFTLRRTDAFPYVYLSRHLRKIAGYDIRAYLVYRRTISRPAYEYLNPSVRIVDPYLFETGNPSLRPQFTRNYEANISAGERPLFAVGINETKDIFTNVVYPADTSSSVSFRTYDNLGQNKETYFRILGAIPPGKRFFFVVVAQYNHNFYQGQYQKSPLSFKRGSWSLFTYQTLRITPLTQLMLNGFVRFNGQLQFYELSTFGALNLSLNQQFFKKKLVVGLSANDVFFTNNNAFTLNQGTVQATGMRQGDTRRFGINIRYHFGFRKKEEGNNLFNMETPDRNN